MNDYSDNFLLPFHVRFTRNVEPNSVLALSTHFFKVLDAEDDDSDTVESFWFKGARHKINLKRASAYLHGSKGKQINIFNKILMLIPINPGEYHWGLYATVNLSYVLGLSEDKGPMPLSLYLDAMGNSMQEVSREKLRRFLNYEWKLMKNKDQEPFTTVSLPKLEPEGQLIGGLEDSRVWLSPRSLTRFLLSLLPSFSSQTEERR